MSRSQLNRAKLGRSVFHQAKLTGAQLKGVDFYAAVFDGGDFTGANLSGSTAENASFAGAIFRNAIMREMGKPTPIDRKALEQVDLEGADLQDTWFLRDRSAENEVSTDVEPKAVTAKPGLLSRFKSIFGGSPKEGLLKKERDLDEPDDNPEGPSGP